MGSKHGYEYESKVSSGDLRVMKSYMKHSELGPGEKCVVIEFRTRFLLHERNRTSGRYIGDELLGFERFDLFGVMTTHSPRRVSGIASSRLIDYWMDIDEIRPIGERVMALVGEKTVEDPSLRRIPVVVDLEVRTVQQAGESFRAARARAIEPSKLEPLWLFLAQTVVERGIHPKLRTFLANLDSVRVECRDDGAAIMPCCCICKRTPCVADEITRLAGCGCPVHRHCVVRHLERKNTCPRCRKPQFESGWLGFADMNFYFHYYDSSDCDSDDYDSDMGPSVDL